MEQGLARNDVCDYSTGHEDVMEPKGTSSCAHMNPLFNSLLYPVVSYSLTTVQAKNVIIIVKAYICVS